MKALHKLTRIQLDILAFLWRRGEATAAGVHEALGDALGLSRKSIGTILRRLTDYGILEHRGAGREYVFRPLITEEEVREAKTRSVLEGVFGGSVPDLVAYALDASDVDSGDLERIRLLIEEWERGGRGHR